MPMQFQPQAVCRKNAGSCRIFSSIKFKGAINMKYVSIVDAKEQFADLVTSLNSNPKEEIFLTFNGKPIIKMTPIKENLPCVKEDKPAPKPNHRRFGIAKGKYNLPPNFDELFDAMDAELWRDVADSYEVKK